MTSREKFLTMVTMDSVMLSLILPCLNEEQNIEKTVRDANSWFRDASIDGEIIVVNDGSIDDTQRIVERLQSDIPCLRIIRYAHNQGYGSAVSSGCDAATKEFVAFMDSDGQFDVADFDRLLPHLRDVDFVTGRRRKRADPFLRKMNAKLFGLLVWVMLGVWVRDINCGMKIFRRSTWQKVRPRHSTGALINAEIFSRLRALDIPWHQVDVPHYPRRFGQQTGANPGVIARMFKELWRLRGARKRM